MIFVVTTGKQTLGCLVNHDDNQYFIIFNVILHAGV